MIGIRSMTKRKGGQKKKIDSPLVSFNYENNNYMIDKVNGKVYRKWIEVEKAREFTIFAAWKNSRHFA